MRDIARSEAARKGCVWVLYDSIRHDGSMAAFHAQQLSPCLRRPRFDPQQCIEQDFTLQQMCCG